MDTDPKHPRDQGAAFLQGEGDQWFLRNREKLTQFSPERDVAMGLLCKHALRPKRVLEIGAANGYRLAAWANRFPCDVKGSDASPMAVADGRERYGIELLCQAAEDFRGLGECDLMLLHFILHWVDRDRLEQLTAEVSQAVVPGGNLLVADFAPDSPVDVPYHHLPPGTATTFKRDYGAHFVRTGHFRQIERIFADHRTGQPGVNIPSAERMGFWLLERLG